MYTLSVHSDQYLSLRLQNAPVYIRLWPILLILVIGGNVQCTLLSIVHYQSPKLYIATAMYNVHSRSSPSTGLNPYHNKRIIINCKTRAPWPPTGLVYKPPRWKHGKINAVHTAKIRWLSESDEHPRLFATASADTKDKRTARGSREVLLQETQEGLWKDGHSESWSTAKAFQEAWCG